MMAITNPTISDIATLEESLSFSCSQGKYGCDGDSRTFDGHLTDFEGLLEAGGRIFDDGIPLQKH